jgi:hypothetical protein
MFSREETDPSRTAIGSNIYAIAVILAMTTAFAARNTRCTAGGRVYSHRFFGMLGILLMLGSAFLGESLPHQGAKTQK